jgi:hypothetical protein
VLEAALEVEALVEKQRRMGRSRVRQRGDGALDERAFARQALEGGRLHRTAVDGHVVGAQRIDGDEHQVVGDRFGRLAAGAEQREPARGEGRCNPDSETGSRRGHGGRA